MTTHGTGSKRVCITGGEGFLGKYLVKKFRDKGYKVSVPVREYFDLRDRKRVDIMYASLRPDIVINVAAVCGGIQACSANPGKFLYDNLVMGLEMLDSARKHGIEKFVQIGSVCSYPLQVEIPAQECDLWNGYPEVTNAPYGIAKRVLIEQVKAYRKQYGMDAIGLIPVNMYGPGDSFAPEKSHAVSSLIRKSIEAKKNKSKLVVWGTGKVTREFLYVEDCADAIVMATEQYNDSEPVNIGTGVETSISRLVRIVTEAVGFTGEIVWDASKPEGQPRRLFDVSRAEKEFGFKAKIGLEEGVKNTVEWYQRTQ